jgi:hypothetical protein
VQTTVESLEKLEIFLNILDDLESSYIVRPETGSEQSRFVLQIIECNHWDELKKKLADNLA